MPKILVVDDDDDAREIARDLLMISGYEVIEASNGPGGVTAAVSERPDLILMDIMMPNLDEGLVATKELRALDGTRDIPVVAFSGLAMDYQKKRALDAGCNDVVVKPYDFDHLLEVVRKYLSGSTP